MTSSSQASVPVPLHREANAGLWPWRWWRRERREWQGGQHKRRQAEHLANDATARVACKCGKRTVFAYVFSIHIGAGVRYDVP